MKCGRLFNRHRWNYPHEYYRICTKCGITQESSIIGLASGGWWTVDFDEWKRRLDERWLMENTNGKKND